MNPLYLDHAATTPVRDEVRAAMEPYSSGIFGNPSSSHRWGRSAEASLEKARADIAEALSAKPSEIRFVRGGTESDNLALIGWCGAQPADAIATLIVSAIEHSAVLEAADHLSDAGRARTVRLAVGPDGVVDLALLEDLITWGATLVSVMWVNNETGIVLPVPEIVEIAHRCGATVHTDASQAIGKVAVDVSEVPVDLLTATGHKINGPKGAGILFVREGTAVRPLLFGGGQERALRPGTEDVAGAVGLATAIQLVVQERESRGRELSALRDRLEAGLVDALTDIRVNGVGARRAPHVSSIGIGGIEDGSALLMALDLEGVAVSGGSACHSGAGGASHVIAALYGEDDALATVRYSFGHGTTEADIDRAVAVTAMVVERVRRVQ